MIKQVLLISLGLVAFTALFSQTVNIAYLDTDRIMEESKMTRDAQEIFTTERQQWERELSELDRDIERLESEFEARKLTLTETGKAQAQERIDAKKAERRRFIESIFGESGRAMQRNAELLEPIMVKLKDSIERIALENNYSIIFDAIGGGILYAKPDLDITELVIRDLNAILDN